jgi:hypothetical protein
MKTKIMRAIERYAEKNSCPYELPDLLDRVDRERPLSDGQRHWIQKAVSDYGAGAPAGNQNAAKPEEDKRTSRITIHVTAHEKAGCVKLANGKINAWGRKKFGLPE